MEQYVKKPERGRVILYLPANLFHSNVLAPHRKVYTETFAAEDGVLAMLRRGGVTEDGQMPVKVSVSLQGIDLAILGMAPDDFAGIELIDAPWAHYLPSLVAGAQHLDEHAKWQMAHGVLRGSAAYFNPEYCTPRQPWLLPRRDYIMPAVGSATVLYSECDDADLAVGSKLEVYDALRYNGNIVVPMKGVEQMTGTYFTFQRYPSEENLAKVVRAVEELVMHGGDRTCIWYLDLEAPLVGTVEKDFAVLDRLLKALVHAGLSEYFVTFADAQDEFRARAAEPAIHGLLSRQLGLKWTKWDMQTDHVRRYMGLRRPVSDREHAIVSLITGSDVLSAMCSKIDGPIVRDAHGSDVVTIGYDPTMIAIGTTALSCYRKRDLDLRAFDDLPTIDEHDPIPPDGKWFARRVAEAIRRLST